MASMHIVKSLETWVRTLPHGEHLLRIFRVACVGLVGFSIQALFFEILGIQLEIMKASTAALIGGEIGIVTNFFLNNHFNFTPHPEDPLSRRLFRFHAVVLGSLIIQYVCVRFAEETSDDLMLLRAAYAVGILLGFVSNYIGYHLFVWKKPTGN